MKCALAFCVCLCVCEFHLSELCSWLQMGNENHLHIKILGVDLIGAFLFSKLPVLWAY